MKDFSFANSKRHKQSDKAESSHLGAASTHAPANSGVVVIGTTVTGVIEAARDNQIFEINLDPGELYEFELLPGTDFNFLSEPFFEAIYDENGTAIQNTSTNNSSVSSGLQVRSLSAGDVTAFPGNLIQLVSEQGGTYFLSVVGFDTTVGQYRLVANDLGILDNENFDIVVDFGSTDVQRSVAQAFEDAVERWEELITADLPFAFVEGYGFIDDILINVLIEDAELSFEGVSQPILAITSILDQRPEDIQAGARLPTHAEIIINRDAVNTVAQNLDELAANAIGRALGFGALWEEFGLIEEIEGDLIYTGPNALREAASLSSSLDGTNILETGANGGLAGQYWNEAILDSELMTSRIEYRGVGSTPRALDSQDNFLSALTIGAMEDLGYGVRYQAADAFEIA